MGVFVYFDEYNSPQKFGILFLEIPWLIYRPLVSQPCIKLFFFCSRKLGFKKADTFIKNIFFCFRALKFFGKYTYRKPNPWHTVDGLCKTNLKPSVWYEVFVWLTRSWTPCITEIYSVIQNILYISKTLKTRLFLFNFYYINITSCNLLWKTVDMQSTRCTGIKCCKLQGITVLIGVISGEITTNDSKLRMSVNKNTCNP